MSISISENNELSPQKLVDIIRTILTTLAIINTILTMIAIKGMVSSKNR
ncbi:hypothetical protein [Lysinibacillus sp. TE18511]